MTTLIAAYNSEGCIGRCDAKCYNATCPDCDCICGGQNHGVGLNKAMDNTRQNVEDWMKAYGLEHEVHHFAMNDAVKQLPLAL